MKKLGAAFALWLWLSPAWAQPVIPQTQGTQPLALLSAATSQIVALITSKSIYVTHWDVIAAGAAGVQLVYGTGTNCATGQGALTGTYQLTAQTGLSVGDGSGIVLAAPQSNAMCVVFSGSTSAAGALSYARF